MATDAPVPLEQYLRPLRNHKKLIVAVAVVVAGLGYLASTRVPTTYRSTASILVTPISADPTSSFESDVEVGMATEERIATSADVVARVSERLADDSIVVTIDELTDNVTVSSPRDSRILDVSYTASTPTEARAGADAFAQTYLDYRSELANDDKAELIEELRAQIELLQEELAQLSVEQARFETDAEPYIAAAVEREAVLSELNAQQDALANLSTLSIEVGRVISPAELPDGPEGLGTLAIVLGSVIGGLIVGFLAAYVVAALKAGSDDSRDQREQSSSNGIEPYDPVRRDDDLAALFSENLWANGSTTGTSLTPANGSHHPMSVADFETLAMQLRQLSKGPMTCVCVGEASRDASLATGLGLAVALQADDVQVLVVDAQLEAPSLDGLLDIPADPGLLDVLAGSAPLKRAQHSLAAMGYLRALTLGNSRLLTDRQRTEELVNGWGMRRLLTETGPLFGATIFIAGTLADAKRLDLLVRESTGIVVGTEQPSGEHPRHLLADALASLPGRTLGLISLDEALAGRAKGGAAVSGP